MLEVARRRAERGAVDLRPTLIYVTICIAQRDTLTLSDSLDYELERLRALSIIIITLCHGMPF